MVSFQRDLSLSVGSSSSNALIHADNMVVLPAMAAKYKEVVKCVYLDPPYNNRDRFTHYSDSMPSDDWSSSFLEMLSMVKPLLRRDGSVWISIDDNEYAYAKVVADQCFGRSSFVATVVWQHRTTRENRKVFSFNHEYIMVYAVDPKQFKMSVNKMPASQELEDRYKNHDNDPRGPWQSVSATAQAGHATKSQFYTLVSPSGKEHQPPHGRCWIYTQTRMNDEIAAGNIWFGKNGQGVPRIKKFMVGDSMSLTPDTLWLAQDVGTTDEAKKHQLSLADDVLPFETPKPERLLHRILHVATNPGDLVLDAFAGSGTTGTVAHKMGRRWIMIEKGEHAKTHIVPRMNKVISGEDQGGVSQLLNWEGGGDFSFFSVE